MKKIISLFTTFCVVFTMLGTFTVFAQDSEADLEISTLAELEAFRDDVNGGNTYEGKTVKLTADIDMSEKYGEGKESWTPIGYAKNADFANPICPFAGTFDGDGHTIKNLYIIGWGSSGLFGENTGTIKNLAVNGTTIYNSDFSGGIVGHNFGTIKNCCFSGEILGNDHLGGLVGLNEGTISDCFNAANITSDGYCVAGIVGLAAGNIERCYNIGNISADSSFASVAVGEDMTVTDCYYLSGTAEKGTEPDIFNTTALTTEQFADKANFTNWDFDTVWEMDANLGRPVFASESEEAIENAFIDANFLAAVRELTGKTNGEHIYSADVESVTKLDIHSKDIRELDGIEYFTGLQSLRCYDNEFSEMDLSHNANLTYINFSYNTDIEAADFSHNPKLETIECNYTYLKELNISENVNLKTLICYGTPLSELNIKNNINLEKLKAFEMFLTDLDVSNNVNLRYLDCSYNYLRKLDVSNNPNLELLICNGNQLGKNPQDAIIGYEAVVEKLGEPTEFDYQKSGFVYYSQKEKCPYDIVWMYLCDKQGVSVNKPRENEDFVILIDVINVEKRDEEVSVLAAVYDTEGKLIHVQDKRTKVAPNEYNDVEFDVPPLEQSIGSIKTFVWDGDNSMKPLGECKIITYTQN